MNDPIGHQMGPWKSLKDISGFKQSGYEVQYLNDHKSSADDSNDDFYHIVSRHMGKTQALQIKTEDTDVIFTFSDLMSPRAFLLFLIPFEKAKILTIGEKWKLHQWFWKQNFKKSNIMLLIPTVKMVTMRHLMKTLF